MDRNARDWCRRWMVMVVAVAASWPTGSVFAQVVQPGQAAADAATEDQSEVSQPTGDESAAIPGEGADNPAEGRYETTVVGPLSSDAPVGEYRQARWTTRRRFPTTRVYVRPKGDVEVEWWLETKLELDGDADPRYRSQYEIEFGLGHRLQLDLYIGTQQFGTGPMELYQQKVELRYALADWGEIPGNPTLYLEWVRQNDAPYKAEVKGLFGGALAPRWFWGLNLVFERELGGEREHEYAITAGVARTMIDERWSFGVETKFETVDVRGQRVGFDAYELLVGPSVQWLPSGNLHVDLVLPLGFEVEGDETTIILEPLLVVGAEI